MANIIDGKKISAELKQELKEKVAQYKEQGIEICLAVIQVGNDKASSVYVGNKKKACEFVGIKSLSYELPEETTEEELLNLVQELNDRADVNGILVQLPLPKHIDENKVIKAIHRQAMFPARTLTTETEIDDYVEKIRTNMKQLLKDCDGIKLS